MDSLANVLGIDRVDANEKVIVIEERHGCNANFLLHSVVCNAVKKNHGICFVLFHNTFSHYENVGMKLGYNLAALKEKGKVTVVEPMKLVLNDVESICKNATGSLALIPTSNADGNMIYNLFAITKEKYLEAAEHSTSVVIVIDDLSHFCDLGLSLKDSMYYVRYLRSLLESENTSQLCVLVHTQKGEQQSFAPDVLVNCLKHMANIFVATEPLKTGYSSDASGKMIINWKYNWPEKATYLYKLMDRQVKVYAPGTAMALQ